MLPIHRFQRQGQTPTTLSDRTGKAHIGQPGPRFGHRVPRRWFPVSKAAACACQHINQCPTMPKRVGHRPRETSRTTPATRPRSESFPLVEKKTRVILVMSNQTSAVRQNTHTRTIHQGVSFVECQNCSGTVWRNNSGLPCGERVRYGTRQLVEVVIETASTDRRSSPGTSFPVNP